MLSIGRLALAEGPYATAAAAYPSFAPNLWPQAPAALQPAMRAYWHEVTALARRVLGIAALALGLPADYFAATTDRHISMLRLICYPPYPRTPEDGHLRAAFPTDLHLLTLPHPTSPPPTLHLR